MKIYLSTFLLLLICSCTDNKNNNSNPKSSKPKIVTTTTMITDLVKNIGGTKIDLQYLMGSGVDPHLYKASEGDVNKLFESDLIIYNGLHLEGKLESIFEKMKLQGKEIIAIAESVKKTDLIPSESFDSHFDPHIWFDIEIWKKCTDLVADKLASFDQENAEFYKNNAIDYKASLDLLSQELDTQISDLTPEEKILITAHDAFNYFGKAFQFKVIGLQGLSTATEAGVRDVQKLSDYVVEQKIKAIFVESSVPKRTIEALQQAVKSKNHSVLIGGTLYSDALGDKNTQEGSYIGMYKHNVSTIVQALK